eukprot:TRINITY_DN3373_c0_g1_i1.p2 TRINITY_DN3373_c0_g1~~TRINITY_DN3373_c0_g1_i1.p2  ORF type:complete len:114 (+),score=2.37 TRINITY_DN3373_c0_g1_i1:150-491(+)
MCIRDRYQRRVRGPFNRMIAHGRQQRCSLPVKKHRTATHDSDVTPTASCAPSSADNDGDDCSSDRDSPESGDSERTDSTCVSEVDHARCIHPYSSPCYHPFCCEHPPNRPHIN